MPETGQHNIEIKQGCTFALLIALAQPSGAPLDLTGCTLRSECRDVSGTLICTFAVTVTDAAAGEISMNLTATATSALTPTATNSHVYDLKMVDSLGSVSRILQGGVMISRGVTL